MSKDDIHIKKKNKGKLRALAKEEGALTGSKVKRSWLEAKANSKDATVRKRAQFAINARGWNHS